MAKPVLLFLKAHVDTFTRKDGAVVQAHDTKVVSAAAPDIGGGSWRQSHKVKLHAPGHAMHGREGEITGAGHQYGFVNVKGKDGETHSMNALDLRPATGHSWPDMDNHQEAPTPPLSAGHAAVRRIGNSANVKNTHNGQVLRDGADAMKNNDHAKLGAIFANADHDTAGKMLKHIHKDHHAAIMDGFNAERAKSKG